jgi:hypothetical protein
LAPDLTEQYSALIEVNPDALTPDGLHGAYLGFTVNQHHANVAVYDFGKCMDILVERDGVSYEDAEEFLQFNTLGAWVGENGPLFITREGSR